MTDWKEKKKILTDSTILQAMESIKGTEQKEKNGQNNKTCSFSLSVAFLQAYTCKMN